jgi:hypothetical protein
MQVLSMANYTEQLIDHMDPVHIASVKNAFVPLILALKILTLDAPGDIRRYNIQATVFDEATVRKILSRRSDFSKDAVSKVKLNIV